MGWRGVARDGVARDGVARDGRRIARTSARAVAVSSAMTDLSASEVRSPCSGAYLPHKACEPTQLT